MKNTQPQYLNSMRQQQQFAEAQRNLLAQQQAQMQQAQLDLHTKQQKMDAFNLTRLNLGQPFAPSHADTMQISFASTGKKSQSTGICRHCGHTPVAKNAIWCPNCQGANPNPSRSVTFVNRLLAVVVTVGFLVFIGLVIALLMNVTG